MSRWKQEFKQHRIHRVLKSIRALVDLKFNDIDAIHKAERKRFLKVLDRLIFSLAVVDPEFLSQENLEQLCLRLENGDFISNLRRYSNDFKISRLHRANDYLTTQITLMLSFIESTSDIEAKERIIKLESMHGRFYDSLNKDKDEINKLKGILTHTLDSFQNKKDKITQDYDNRLKDEYQKFLEELSEKHEVMKEKHQEVLDIHQMVIEDGVAADYKTHADNEKKSAQLWRRITMVFYILTLLWLVLRVIFGHGFADDGAFDWHVFLATMSVTAVALGVAQFTSRQSLMHRAHEQQMRWFSLEVKAIGPFIESLPSKIPDELRNKLFERMFGMNRVAENKPRNRSFFLKPQKKD